MKRMFVGEGVFGSVFLDYHRKYYGFHKNFEFLGHENSEKFSIVSCESLLSQESVVFL